MKISLRGALVFILSVLSACPFAWSDVGMMLDGPIGVGATAITGAGHASVYFSRVCPASPVKLRMCAPGEQGSVLSNQKDFGENAHYEWNIVPLSVFLYGVEDPQNAPLIATAELQKMLRAHQRATRFREVCGNGSCPDLGHWKDQIAEALVREVYIFEVSTTREEDEEFVKKFNARENVNHYNGLLRNCAGFARIVMNTYFPRATHADYLNDFGIASPKAISRSFTRYGIRHPEREFHVVRYAQLPGGFRHSYDARNGTEVAFRSVCWLLPLTLQAHGLGYFAATYALTGRFNPHTELRRRPSETATRLMNEIKQAKQSGNTELASELESQLKAERGTLLGTNQDWENYRARYEELLQTAIADGIVGKHEDLHRYLRRSTTKAQSYVDEQGSSWIEFTDAAGTHRVGLTRDTVLSGRSDHAAAVKLLLARMDAVLRERKKYREPWSQASTDAGVAAAVVREHQELERRRSGDVAAPGTSPLAMRAHQR